MPTPFQVTFRNNVQPSPALSAHLRQRAEKLDAIYGKIASCHVVVERVGLPGARNVRHSFAIHVGLPEHDLFVDQPQTEDHVVRTALESADAAFDATERRLLEWVERRRELRRIPTRNLRKARPGSEHE